MKTANNRLLSIDVLRAITMLLMIFVNDVSGVRDIPAWIDHVAASDDGLGFADTIFPAFLFIVGLSLPIAISNRISRGQSFLRIAIYIISRSVALIVMGFFHVNGENYSAAATLPRAVWTILLTISFFLIWLDYPSTMMKAKKYALIGIGVVLLLLMAYFYQGGSVEHPEGLKPHWWGILGIIGWAYLVSALVFLFTKGRFVPLLISLAVFITINIAVHTGNLHINIPVIGDASSITLIMAGVVIAILYRKLIGQENKTPLWLLLTITGIATIAAGLLIRPYTGGISKIYATPAWVFICTGISMFVFELIIWLVDIHKKQNWFSIIRPAGTSTLTCYLLPYILYSVYALLDFNYPDFFNKGGGGVFRSFAVAFVLIFLGGLLEKKRIRLKI